MKPASVYDLEDGNVFVSGHRLRRSFEYHSVYTRGRLILRDVHPYGPFIVVNVVCVLQMIEHFRSFTIKNLVEIGRAHGLVFSKTVRKDAAHRALIAHTCVATCKRQDYISRVRLSIV